MGKDCFDQDRGVPSLFFSMKKCIQFSCMFVLTLLTLSCESNRHSDSKELVVMYFEVDVYV